MTKEQRADALLCAAKHWQMGVGRDRCCRDDIEASTVFVLFMECAEPEDADWIEFASAALSEVAAMGFDIETVEQKGARK